MGSEMCIRDRPKAEELVAEAEKAEKEGNREKASEFYMYVLSI